MSKAKNFAFSLVMLKAKKFGQNAKIWAQSPGILAHEYSILIGC